MPEKPWLTLTEYSNDYKVSISTLRRRIKGDQAEFKYEGGKYLLRNLPLSQHEAQPQTKPKPKRSTQEPPAPPQQKQEAGSSATKESALSGTDSQGQVDTTSEALLAEIKKAYRLILQEKEEQIFLLKDEVADLKTLIRVLESENERLKSNLKEKAPIDSWLDDLETRR